jgi:hypothetical protein
MFWRQKLKIKLVVDSAIGFSKPSFEHFLRNVFCNHRHTHTQQIYQVFSERQELRCSVHEANARIRPPPSQLLFKHNDNEEETRTRLLTIDVVARD